VRHDAHKYTSNWEPRTENRILFVGRVTGEKQIDVLLRAATCCRPNSTRRSRSSAAATS